MYKLTDTGYRDKNKEIIYMGSTLRNASGNTFLVILDPHFSFSLYNRELKTIEKLNKEVSAGLVVVSSEERNSLLL